MKASILIVSRDRKAELRKTIFILEKYIRKDKHEVLVFLDASTDGSEELQKEFPWIRWEISTEGLGASRARNVLYRHAKGEILFGFDDDSHPLQHDFIERTTELFNSNDKLGIIAFREIKGVFESDDKIPLELKTEGEDFLVKEFLGCGFAIKKKVYNKTRGFPTWIDIYGEEVCLAIETLELGHDILFTHRIAVNHRTQKQKNNLDGANYFRFGRQLKNSAFFYMVYYPFPLLLKKIIRLYILNFCKYALKDKKFFVEYFKAFVANITSLKQILIYRKPVSREVIQTFNNLSSPFY